MVHRFHLIFQVILVAGLLTACSGVNSAASPTTIPTLQATTQVLIPLTSSQSTSIPASGQATDEQASPSPVPSTAAPAAAAPAAGQCTAPASLTPAETEGPFFKAGSPEKSSLIDANTTGTRLLLTGTVLNQDCQPVAHALLDFWQANAQGQYDNTGYTLRGHQYTDASGRYQLETIVPGLYPGRTLHIHVKVQAPNGPILTTQVFFPGIQQNDSDSIFDPKLLIAVQDTSSGMLGSFNFVVSLK
jgi:protocatechuate 3,4-dioxygenase beta subunit